jgi:hypothetical protein
MAIPEHSECVKAHKRMRNYSKRDKNYYAAISNRDKRIKAPVFKKPKMRKINIWFAKVKWWRAFARRKSWKLGYGGSLFKYYQNAIGPYYRKWGKYMS